MPKFFVEGKVAGFLIIRNGNERLEYATPEAMAAEVNRVREIEREFWKKHPRSCTGTEYSTAGIPADEYFTLMRHDDNGQVEEQGGADYTGKTKIGDPFIKKFCESCGGNPVWFQYEERSAHYLFKCETCVDKDIEGHHDGGLEREY